MTKRLLALLLLAALTTGLFAYAIDPAYTAGDPEKRDAATQQQTLSTPAPQPPTSAAAGQNPVAAGQTPAPRTTPKATADARSSVPKNYTTAKTDISSFSGLTARGITFYGLDKTVRENHPTIKANEQTIKGLEAIDPTMGELFLPDVSALKESLKKLQELSASLEGAAFFEGDGSEVKNQLLIGSLQAALSGTKMQIESAIASAEGGKDQIESGKDTLEDQIATAKRSFAYQADMLVYSAESLYITVATMRRQMEDAQQGIETIDRTIAEMETRYKLGQISELKLAQLKNQRESTASQVQSLSFSIDSLESDMALTLGWDLDSKVEISGLTEITDSQLRSMNFQNDLTLALANSFAIWQARDALRSADNAYEKDEVSTLHNVNAAKLALEQAERTTTQSFRKLFNTVLEKKRMADSAQQSFDMQVRTYDAAKMEHSLGRISKNALSSAEDDLNAAKSAVKSAQYDLFLAYNQYSWAKRGAIQ